MNCDFSNGSKIKPTSCDLPEFKIQIHHIKKSESKEIQQLRDLNEAWKKGIKSESRIYKYLCYIIYRVKYNSSNINC